MSPKKSVDCRIQGFRARYEYEAIAFNTGRDLSLIPQGKVGPKGISPVAADLLDFAAAIYQIERQLRRKNTSPPTHFTLHMQLRDPKAWNGDAIRAAQDVLYVLGDAVWDLNFTPGLRVPPPAPPTGNGHAPKQVALFSGGMDSACGLATIHMDAARTQLVSFYTRQKTQQQTIATELGYDRHCQWRMVWNLGAGRGHSFFYRSFLFLSLGAVVAESWNIRRLFQFENGVLATAIPPGSAWLMTKHAHPLLHHHVSKLFAALFGGDWQILNPFLGLTKRACVEQAIRAIGRAKAMKLLGETETCWFLWSHLVIGGRKTPGVPCGICIPCIIRRTTKVDEKYSYDLLRHEVRNNERQGANFRSYYIFLKQVLKTKKSSADFYAILPPSGRELLATSSSLSLDELHRLFLDFAKEFMSTFKLR